MTSTTHHGARFGVRTAKEDKQNDRRYHEAGERPDRDWTGRPGRSPTLLSAPASSRYAAWRIRLLLARLRAAVATT
jgi:hypothetical protein